MLAERIKKWPEQWEERGIQKGIQKGIQQGRMETRLETARNLIVRTEMDDSLIAEISGLSVEAVTKLRAETKH
jgi:predicted transposase/invertase (TIGR01784 family)